MPENAYRTAHLYSHLSAGTRAEFDTPWISGPGIGPCARCREPCIRYGPQGGPLCLDCRGPS